MTEEIFGNYSSSEKVVVEQNGHHQEDGELIGEREPVKLLHQEDEEEEEEEDGLEIHNPKFRPPRWYRHNNNPRRCPGQICWHHDHICEQVEHTIRVLSQSAKPLEEKITKKEWEEREEKMHQVIQDQMEHLLKKRNSCRKLSKRRNSKKKKKTTTREVLADHVSWNFPLERDESEVKKQQAIQDQLRKNRKNMKKKKKKKTMLEEEEVVDNHMSWIPWPEQQDNQFSSIYQLEQENHQGDNEVRWISQPEQDNRIDNHQQDNQVSWITLPEQEILPPPEWTNPLPECKKCTPLPPEWTIEVGKRYEVSRLLSGKTRDCLVKRDGDKVKIDDCISGKHVILYFWWLSDDGLTPDNLDHDINLDLKEAYSTYNPQGKFEVVFVALGNNEDNFLDSFSHMPWLAIPHKDKEARAFFIEEFAIPSSLLATPILFAPDGTAMLKTAWFNITIFGAYGFPFTERRIDEICSEARARCDKLILEKVKPSLTELIGEYVISPEGNQLPAIAAFGPSGKLETRESNLAFKKKWIHNYPFIQDDMCDEVHSALIQKHKWSLGNLFDSSNVSSR